MSESFELICRECRRRWGNAPRSICEECFSPLEIAYDFDAPDRRTSRAQIAAGPPSIWRYASLLPIPADQHPSIPVGFTPLVEARRLAARWGLRHVFLKNDAVCFPSLSFKDRVVAVALAAARRFEFDVVSCSSTGNLANAVAAQARREGFEACVFIPADLEPAKILNTRGCRICGEEH